MATLVIVESPGKIKKIQQILGSGYTVKASLGHVRDLPRRELGIDVEAGFTPRYEPLPDKKQVIQSLKRAAAGAEMVYLATDPDREGEAIAWHIQKLLPRGTRSQRISFNEITPDAVLEAVHTPRAIDQALVEAQNARRVIDRLVGYKVSPLLQEAMQDRNLSAGRVQTSALRLLVERERERANFQPRHYWTLYVQLAHTRLPFYARLVKPMTIPSPGERDFFVTQFARASRWWVDHVEATTDTTRPPAPFTTSTLQQEAAKVYQFTPDETLAAAQKLYEAGFISYIRTDATHIAPEAQRQARATIAKLFGDSYIPPEPPHYRSRPGAQEAHEAIRPTDVALHPATLGQSPDSAELSPAGHQLYDLIWQRFTASQMAPATYAVSQAHVRCGEQANPLPYPFAARARELSFPGFKRVYQEAPDVDETPGDDEEHSTRNTALPPLKAGDPLDFQRLLTPEQQTRPPQKFTPARLIASMEQQGIGRPSTYAPTVKLLLDRNYAQTENGTILPTLRGEQTLDYLVEICPDVFSVHFTAEMEEQLDQIASGLSRSLEVISFFYYQKLAPSLQAATAALLRSRQTGEVCPQCGGSLIHQRGKHGPTVACANWPQCAYTRSASAGHHKTQPAS